MNARKHKTYGIIKAKDMHMRRIGYEASKKIETRL